MTEITINLAKSRKGVRVIKIRRTKIRKRQIVLIGSMSVYSELCAYAEVLNNAGIPTIVPEAEKDALNQYSLQDLEQFKREVSHKHIRQVRHPETWGVLAVNLDRHGILNYVGPNTFAEIAVAFAQFKKIYLIQSIPHAYLDELSAWQAIPLKGRLDTLIEDYMEATRSPSRQLKLFE
ncbi:hypothetical protein CRN80_00545 [Pseudomonas sp. FDAARGOS_380]|uniref:hypothetical protein n=1 Tax=unclassified Pseudomonas TaxID=196821 RepID=UPI000BFCC8CA|nr:MULTISPECIES: hypothetical protein [unclassified Pseudomonas]ATN08247.1 hypothetical protein CRN80_00545 [Pseudomonas sp. FDAARGOS_380]